MNNYRKGRVPALCVSLLSGIFAQIASAQQSHSDSGQLEEITVTAEKRESTVQTTAISLTAVSGQDIQDRGLTDLGNLLTSVPGVSIRTSGPGMTEFEMRGVSSTGGNSPTVGFYYDDTSLTAPAASNEGKIVISPALYDLNRVEVLRGPQGTLYGSGSMGGTIKLVPNAPNPEAFDASSEVVFADTDHGGFDHAENAMVNLPFGGGLAALRLVGSYSRDAGWIDRVVIAPGDFPSSVGTTRGNVLAAPVEADYHDVNDVERTTLRASVLLKPIDGLTISPSFLYQKLQAGGLPYIDSVPGTDVHYQPFDVAENYSDEFKLGSLNVTYTTPILALTSITSYWSRNEPLTQDTSESWTTGLGPAYVTGYTPAQGGLGASSAIEYNPTHQTTEELRISSVGDSRLKWLAGYYYEDFHSAWDIVFPSQNGAALFGSNNLFSYFSPMPIYQQSVFGEVTYNITDPWAITIGARRYRYNAPVSLDQYGSLTATVMTSTSEKDQGVTPKASMSYQFTKDLMVYATAAKGFRPGGGTGPVPTSGPATCEQQLQQEYGSTGFVNGPISFKSDNVWSYEVGEKWRFADNRVTLNSALYFEKWAGVQQSNSLSTCGYTYTVNAGDAHVRGGELEIQTVVVPELTLSGNVGYTHAALVSSTLINAGFNPGTPIQDVPQWTSTVSAAYRHPMTDRLALTARADSTYTGSRTDATYSINQLPSYDLTNLRAGVDGGRWSAVLFVNNVTDKRALLNNIVQDAENIPTYNRVAVSQPRTAGIDVNYRFGGQ
ncbi:MAG TPA: TonB-dependent receptor [Steroidobacteraceae bacterium]|jgi:outer membrane receptor protein involved in Fe transport|nr:TonB-dependent receptor [Steroidobacteraceae bacterium]